MSAKRTDEYARLFDAAAREGIVVLAFNIPYIPMTSAVADSLEQYDAYGLIQVAELEVRRFESKSVTAIAEEYRRVANPRVAGLHLDHTPVIDEFGDIVDWRRYIAEAIEAGYDSVMIDGSRLPLDENIVVTGEVVRMAHPEGVLVEAELGSVLGHESGPLPPYDELFATKAGFTIPEEAKRFVDETQVDWLSVSVGSVHGAIAPATKNQEKVQAKLDIERLRELRDATGVPLVLHGGSGIQQQYIDESVRNGIVKINIATDIRQPYERALAAGGSVSDAQAAVSEAMRRLIRDVHRIEGSATRLRALM
ncbi:MAG: class II fructose-bisphosphate aldolase [Armatimonadota bacterium]|nr:class II fructose-bisphosphate aldolase [Armatimonadota bacterium]